MTDLVMVECRLPPSPVRPGHFNDSEFGTAASGVSLSVSNNGVHESEVKLKLITYDSACMDCNVTSGCFVKVGSEEEQLYKRLGKSLMKPSKLRASLNGFLFKRAPNIYSNVLQTRSLSSSQS